MSSIVVEFEVLPEDGPSSLSATAICGDLRRQLQDPGSNLRQGEFRHFASRATLSDGGDLGPTASSYAMEDSGDAARPSSRPQGTAESLYTSADPGRYQGWGPQSGPGPYDAPISSGGDVARYGNGDWQGGGLHYDGGARNMSNAELVDRISHLERELKHTAGGGRPQDLTSMPRRSVEVEALEEKCALLQQRLEAVEPELREAQEAARSYRSKAEQAELRLKDRDQLLAHAKEMWMKENVRASKLADALTAAEDQLADQERRLAETIERYDRAQQEVRQLQYLLGGTTNGGGGFGGSGGFANGGLSDPYASPSKGIRENGYSKPSFESSLAEADMAGLPSRPSTMPNLMPLAENGRAVSYEVSEAETNAERFRRLCGLNDAVLYEDELLQVGLKMEFNGRNGTVAVYFGNKGSAALQAFTPQYFVREDSALRLSATTIAQQIDADAQVVQRVNIQLLEPFVEPPWLRIQFLLPDASPRRIQTRFPVVLTKFMTGRELNSSEFFRLWRQQNFALNEATSVVHISSHLNAGPPINIARSLMFGSALRLHHGIDVNPDNLVMVGQLLLGADGPQSGRERRDWDRERGYGEALGDEPDMGLSLIRVEIGRDRFAGKARVVVRSGSHAVAKALCDGIVGQLAEVPSSGNFAVR